MDLILFERLFLVLFEWVVQLHTTVQYNWRIVQTGHGASMKGEHNSLLVVKIMVIKGVQIWDFDK